MKELAVPEVGRGGTEKAILEMHKWVEPATSNGGEKSCFFELIGVIFVYCKVEFAEGWCICPQIAYFETKVYSTYQGHSGAVWPRLYNYIL